SVAASRAALDPELPGLGESPYLDVRLEGRVRLRDLLGHLYVLIPVLDRDKHYWVGEDEIEKLLSKGEGWLEGHPHREKLVHRYLLQKHWLTRRALARLEDEGAASAAVELAEDLTSSADPTSADPTSADPTTAEHASTGATREDALEK